VEVSPGVRRFHVFVMNADGTNQTDITPNDVTLNYQPSLSPDGSKVLFVSLRNSYYEVYVANSDGTNLVRMTDRASATGGYHQYPAFSPDGEKIVFMFFSSGENGIYLMNSDGSDRTLLTSDIVADSHPTFSPDGEKIAFGSSRGDGIKRIWLMNRDATNLVRLDPIGSYPSWGKGPRRPVMIVPGIAGTYASDTDNDIFWLLKRGMHPDEMQIDPVARVYDDLIKTFENLGYVKNKDLFVVNYDWRLLPGPRDAAFDGIVDGITATSISDEQFRYGVDYLGLALRKAY
jgi:Tol biopolymer transport system component